MVPPPLAELVAGQLAGHGWEYVVVDIQAFRG